MPGNSMKLTKHTKRDGLRIILRVKLKDKLVRDQDLKLQMPKIQELLKDLLLLLVGLESKLQNLKNPDQLRAPH